MKIMKIINTNQISNFSIEIEKETNNSSVIVYMFKIWNRDNLIIDKFILNGYLQKYSDRVETAILSLVNNQKFISINKLQENLQTIINKAIKSDEDYEKKNEV